MVISGRRPLHHHPAACMVVPHDGNGQNVDRWSSAEEDHHTIIQQHAWWYQMMVTARMLTDGHQRKKTTRPSSSSMVCATYGDSVVCDSATASLADGGGVFQDGATGGQDVDEDLPAMTCQHVGDDLHPCLAGLLQHHCSTFGNKDVK